MFSDIHSWYKVVNKAFSPGIYILIILPLAMCNCLLNKWVVFRRAFFVIRISRSTITWSTLMVEYDSCFRINFVDHVPAIIRSNKNTAVKLEMCHKIKNVRTDGRLPRRTRANLNPSPSKSGRIKWHLICSKFYST